MCDCYTYISVSDKGVDEAGRHVITAKQTLYSEGSGNSFKVENNVITW